MNCCFQMKEKYLRIFATKDLINDGLSKEIIMIA